ncbi:mini-MOMP protein [Campylobacter vulpis]|uniref:mini-MOMP protein n=1 Tax=Campylobacter vulpis TaxID=1655500 RepID=UPI001BCC5C8C|nr:mini-MOMP protein [Campylobacter vulpis]MBS4234964.1 mini-MOMP protein [Campylobacter vulpis]MBS4268573.1 mini-MOMP protein [Campylobacter vulpis]
MRKFALICVFLSLNILVSNAAPLDEAFKDVEVSGTVRYRYESSSTKLKDRNSKSSTKTRTDITIQ